MTPPAKRTPAKKTTAKKAAPKAAVSPARDIPDTSVVGHEKNIPPEEHGMGTREPKQRPNDAPVTAVKHLFCGTVFKPPPAILEALNLNQWNNGLDCPLEMAYRPLSEFAYVRD